MSEGLVVTSEQALDASKEVGDWPDRTERARDHRAVERGEPEMQIRGYPQVTERDGQLCASRQRWQATTVQRDIA